MFRLSALSFALACTIFSVISVQSAPTEPRRKDFVIQNDDGYGTSDCLVRGSACGKIVADAWCESKGFAKALAYRPTDVADVTHSTSAARSTAVESFVISCSE